MIRFLIKQKLLRITTTKERGSRHREWRSAKCQRIYDNGIECAKDATGHSFSLTDVLFMGGGRGRCRGQGRERVNFAYSYSSAK